MSDSIWLKRTNRGKVVYETSRPLEDRPSHFFSCRDVERIIRKIECGHFVIPASLWSTFSREFDSLVRDFFRRSADPDFDFGGGEFGGGGATRDFEDVATAESAGRIFILKEKEK